MAIIWQRRIGNDHYEVRSAGRTRRLYSNGVLHSQYNPRGACGGVWDLLWLPGLMLRRPALRMLVLGVGGGAVLRCIHDLLQPVELVGVDIDGLHLSVARRFFGLRGPGWTLVHGDARTWLRRYRGPPFDMIVDDLFGHEGGVPQRAIAVDRHWRELLSRHTARHGVLVINFADGAEVKACAFGRGAGAWARFRQALTLTTPHYNNMVAAIFDFDVSTRQLRDRVAALSISGKKPCFRVRRRPEWTDGGCN